MKIKIEKTKPGILIIPTIAISYGDEENKKGIALVWLLWALMIEIK